jgi:hypothetical protein
MNKQMYASPAVCTCRVESEGWIATSCHRMKANGKAAWGDETLTTLGLDTNNDGLGDDGGNIFEQW